MTPKFKTRDVARSLYVNFIKKADECFHAAQTSFGSGEWNACAINAIHCCISACDAMCVYCLGKRSSGEDHNEAAVLLKTIKHDERTNANVNRLLRILRTKNIAEYEERLVNRSEADKIMKDCERFLEYVKGEIG